MGCPSSVELGDNLVFSICTHDPDTGVLTDADAAPTYRVYEDETAVAILTGTMTKLDDANTTGFYTELIACTIGNGFEDRKTYTIYVEATVDSDTGGISFAFKIMDTPSLVNTEILDVLNVDTFAEPGQEAPGATVSLVKKIGYLYKAWRNKKDNDGTTRNLYNDDAATVDQKSSVSEAAGTVTTGEWRTGP